MLYRLPVTFLASVLLTLAPASAQADDVATQIAREGLSWRSGETSMSRLTPQEQRRRLLPPGPHPLLQDFVASPPDIAAPAPMNRQALPSALDWRNLDGFNFVTPVRDQGSCGSCWAFSTVATMEALIAYRRSVAEPTLDLSEQHLLDCSGVSFGCEGGGITWDIPVLGIGPATFVRQNGIVTEQCLPYASGATGSTGTCPALPVACSTEAEKAESFTPLTSTTPGFPQWDPPPYTMSQMAETEVKANLLERPVGTSMQTFNDLYQYKSGIYQPTATATKDGMHAVLIVGYNDAEQYWIVKNSWGDDWGEDGYVRIRYGASSIGMFSYVYGYAEATAAAVLCPDLPSTLDLDLDTGEPVDLHIANCGGGVLKWEATLNKSWLRLENQAAEAVSAGSEVAAGTTYQVRAVGASPGSTGTIVLGCAANAITIEVVANGTVADAGPDADEVGSTSPDAAMQEPHDAGTDGPESDSEPAGDAPVIPEPLLSSPASDDGCGCRVGGRSSEPLAFVSALLLALAVARRRLHVSPPAQHP